VRFLSIELPLENLGQINLQKINWVIVGGESGHGARPMEAAWVRNIQNQCRNAGVAFFFKQWGRVRKSETGRDMDGKTYSEFPDRRQAEVPTLEFRRETLERLEAEMP
jgi:protein gp37